MAAVAAASAWWWRRRAAWPSQAELSVPAMVRIVVVGECFQRGEDPLEGVLDLAEVVGQAEVPVGVGLGDETPVGGGLAAVDVQELWSGLEVGAGEAGVGVRAVLLGGVCAVSVGQAVANPVEVVFDPFGGGGRAVGVVADPLAGDVDPLGLVMVERFSDGGVMDAGVVAGHVRAGVS